MEIGEKIRIIRNVYHAVNDEMNRLGDRLAAMERQITRRAIRARAELDRKPMRAGERAARLALLDSILKGVEGYQRKRTRLQHLEEYETWLREELVGLRSSGQPKKKREKPARTSDSATSDYARAAR